MILLGTHTFKLGYTKNEWCRPFTNNVGNIFVRVCVQDITDFYSANLSFHKISFLKQLRELFLLSRAGLAHLFWLV